MNFLAHCLIAARAGAHHEQDEAMLVAGGFLGDFLKGPVSDELPASLAAGVRLHRRIDAYSNTHPMIRESCNRFPSPLRRLAPIFVDVIADHLLSTEWSSFESEPVSNFTHRTYQQIAATEAQLPASGKRFFRYMRDNDLLASYHDWQVVSRAMCSITRRLDQQHLDVVLEEEVEPLLGDLRDDFLSYFPDLLAHGREWLNAAQRSS